MPEELVELKGAVETILVTSPDVEHWSMVSAR